VNPYFYKQLQFLKRICEEFSTVLLMCQPTPEWLKEGGIAGAYMIQRPGKGGPMEHWRVTAAAWTKEGSFPLQRNNP
jgi:hypothetical protein